MALALLGLDRLLKTLILQNEVLSGPLFGLAYPRWTFHQNFGTAFNLPVPLSLIMAASFLFLVFCCRWIWQRRAANSWGMILLILGAASNLYDRLRFGFVIDMIETVPGSVWNLSDLMILLGALFLIRPFFAKKDGG